MASIVGVAICQLGISALLAIISVYLYTQKVLMSDNHEEAHTGPIKTPKSFAWLVFLSFVGPIFIIIGLVNYVVSQTKPSAGAAPTAESVAARIQKVGAVQVRDANRPLKAGEDVYKAQCAACHAAGLAGSPKVGDKTAWAPRIKTGYEALLNSALKGKNAMGAQGGGEHNDTEIGRAVVYMANASGAKFAEPAAPAN
jgi:cytochrome c5